MAPRRPRKLAELSVQEIRTRYLGADAPPPSPQVLTRLRRDRRSGVKALYRTLKTRWERDRDERQRLDALLNFERVLWKTGIERIAGVDEAGVGPLAGPVVAAAVVFRPGVEIAGVDDSKRLDPARREELEAEIREHAAGIGIGTAEVDEIDRLNVYHAALAAMRKAVEALPEPPQHVLVDAREIPGVTQPQNRFDRGDGLNFSIAAASIVAKTHRDRLMCELDARHPGYGFAQHKGYATADHQQAIARLGPCAAHRLSYAFIRELCGEFSELFYELKGELDDALAHADLERLETEVARRRDDLAEEEQKKLRMMIGRRWEALAG